MTVRIYDERTKDLLVEQTNVHDIEVSECRLICHFEGLSAKADFVINLFNLADFHSVEIC